MTGVPSRTGRFLVLALACLVAWRAAAVLVLVSGELSPSRLSRTARSWETPVETRIRRSLGTAMGEVPEERDVDALAKGRRNAQAAYRLLELETPPDARVYFATPEGKRGFRMFRKLSALLYPRTVFCVCGPPPDFTSSEAGARWGVGPGSYVLVFETEVELSDPRLVPVAEGPGARLFLVGEGG